jgi:ABC-type amino acid transport substrate-binding protein
MRKIIWVLSLFLPLFLSLSVCAAKDPLSSAQRTWLTERNVIRVGVFNDYPPFGFVDNTGTPKGMSIEFWRLLSSKLGFWVQFYPVSFREQLNGLEAGKYDSLAGIFPLKERRENFDFSRPYTTIRTNIYVKTRSRGVKNLGSLRGSKVAVVEGDSGEAICIRAGIIPFRVTNYLQAIFELANGDADAIVMDELVVGYYAKRHGLEKKIRQVGQPVDIGSMTLPVRKGNKRLLEILNAGIGMISRAEWAKIERKWLANQ